MALNGFGELLIREKSCLEVKDCKGKYEKHPLAENSIAEVRLRSGNLVSVGALATCAFWNVNLIVQTQGQSEIPKKYGLRWLDAYA